jgi:hypothetical protein
MERQFQFSLGNSLAATAIIAVWCALLANYSNWYGDVTLYCMAIEALPALAVGVLVGRPVVGLLCAAASAMAMAVLIHQSGS